MVYTPADASGIFECIPNFKFIDWAHGRDAGLNARCFHCVYYETA